MFKFFQMLLQVVTLFMFSLTIWAGLQTPVLSANNESNHLSGTPSRSRGRGVRNS